MGPALLTALCLLIALPASAALVTTPVEYRHGDEVLEGYLAYDDAVPGTRPGILVVHEWYGLNDYTRSRTEQLARLGYLAFAADIYGKGKQAADAEGARHLAGVFWQDQELLRARAAAGLEQLRAHALVDGARVAAVGYCFGGTTVLELARANAAVQGVVSFHGGLKTADPAATSAVGPKVLVLHGADDPFIPAEDLAAFQEEMRRAGADWQLVLYGGAQHSFSNPAADGKALPGALYDERADRRSWQHMQAFLGELFR
ncbi:MAG: dienelactone hydrolase family protein [Deferrisomatales bacterium]|nr:dienelactone hydrolase family protein [Deferrisomatales bacterium]